MAKKNSLEKVPFLQSGAYDEEGTCVLGSWSMCSYPPRSTDVEWRPNKPFEATFKLDGMSRGMSSALLYWRDIDSGTTYPMFISSVVDLIGNSNLLDGYVTGWWIAVKRGSNYGIERYEA